MEDFDKIYAEYYSEVYKFVLSLCQNPMLAEEITQESFFKALKSIDSFNGNCKLSTWLCKIARNTLYSYTKKHNKQVDYPLDAIISYENIEEQFADKETAYAILETNGDLNAVKMADATGNNIPLNVIVNGEYADNNIKMLNLTRKDIDKKLLKNVLKTFGIIINGT